MQGELSASLLDLITCSCVNRAMTQATGHDRWGYDQLTAIPLKTDMSPGANEAGFCKAKELLHCGRGSKCACISDGTKVHHEMHVVT